LRTALTEGQAALFSRHPTWTLRIGRASVRGLGDFKPRRWPRCTGCKGFRTMSGAFPGSEPSLRHRLVRDRDAKFCRGFDEVFGAEGAEVLVTPVRAPRANAYAERWVRTVRAECLDWLLIVGRGHLEQALRVYVDHYNWQRPHPGAGTASARVTCRADRRWRGSAVRRRDLLGGLARLPASCMNHLRTLQLATRHRPVRLRNRRWASSCVRRSRSTPSTGTSPSIARGHFRAGRDRGRTPAVVATLARRTTPSRPAVAWWPIRRPGGTGRRPPRRPVPPPGPSAAA
jgi:Integrase core domain